MTPTRAVLLSRLRASKSPDRTLTDWLTYRPERELFEATWDAVPNVEQLDALAELAGCPKLWRSDAMRRVDAEVARVRLAAKPGELAGVHAAGTRAYRSCIGAEMIESCLRAERSWGEA